MTLSPFVIPAVVVALVIGFVFAQRTGAARRLRIENEVRQVMLQRLVDDIRGTFADPALSPDDVEAIATVLIAQMQTYNADGQLDAFIADNQAAVAEQLAARRAASR